MVEEEAGALHIFFSWIAFASHPSERRGKKKAVPFARDKGTHGDVNSPRSINRTGQPYAGPPTGPRSRSCSDYANFECDTATATPLDGDCPFLGCRLTIAKSMSVRGAA